MMKMATLRDPNGMGRNFNMAHHGASMTERARSEMMWLSGMSAWSYQQR